MDPLFITNQDFGPKNTLSNLMDQIDTATQINGLCMRFTQISTSSDKLSTKGD
jgi:hypothetical protein